MGKDFASSILNEEYAKLHTFFVELDKGGVNFTKKGKVVAWAADFIFLDLPSSSYFMHDTVPEWNTLTEDHVRHGIGVAGACLRDSGWFVCLATLAGTCYLMLHLEIVEYHIWIHVFSMHDFFIFYLKGSAPTWIEKHVSCLDLEIVRRFVIENGVCYGEIVLDGIITQVFDNMLFFSIMAMNMLH